MRPQAKVDFAFLYGLVLIASPERLWPPSPPRTRPLTEGGKARAKTIVPRLGAESPDDRDRAAAELRQFGPPVIPILEAGAGDPDPEISGRCKVLAAEMRPSPANVFGPAAVERQKLAGNDATLYAKLKPKNMTYKVKDLQMIHCFQLLLAQIEGATFEGKCPEVKLSFSFEDLPLMSILSVMTQSSGADWIIENGKLIVGPRDEIARRLPPGK